MAERVWDRFLTERDKAVFGSAGYGVRQGFGKRPALLVIDVNYAFCGDKREPILESIKRWRQSAGEEAWDAIPILQRLSKLVCPVWVPRSRALVPCAPDRKVTSASAVS